MTSEHPTYPERTTDDERRNALLQMQIYEALGVAANDAHAVLDSVLSASDPDAARRALEDRYEFTERQAQAVMDLPFGRLTSTDRHTFEQHRRQLSARVAALDESVGGTWLARRGNALMSAEPHKINDMSGRRAGEACARIASGHDRLTCHSC